MRHPPHLQTLERLLPSLHAPCLRWATRCCGGDSEEGADLVQELYIRLWDGRLTPPVELLQPPVEHPQLRAWLFAVLRRLATNQLRALKRRVRLLTQLTGLLTAPHQSIDAESALIQRSERASTRAKVELALTQLSGRQREVIELVFDHELTVEQASEVMGVSVGSARVHYDRAKRKLSELLTAQSEPDGPRSAPEPHTPTAGDLT